MVLYRMYEGSDIPESTRADPIRSGETYVRDSSEGSGETPSHPEAMIFY